MLNNTEDMCIIQRLTFKIVDLLSLPSGSFSALYPTKK